MLRHSFRGPTFAVFIAIGLVHVFCAARDASAQSQGALQFDGVNDFVTFGQAPSLGVSTFTIEVRFKRTGPGSTANTGTGGVVAVPLLSKGRSESDGSNLDMN